MHTAVTNVKSVFSCWSALRGRKVNFVRRQIYFLDWLRFVFSSALTHSILTLEGTNPALCKLWRCQNLWWELNLKRKSFFRLKLWYLFEVARLCRYIGLCEAFFVLKQLNCDPLAAQNAPALVLTRPSMSQLVLAFPPWAARETLPMH